MSNKNRKTNQSSPKRFLDGRFVTRRRLKIKCRTRVRNEEEVERKRSIARQNDKRLNVRTARRGQTLSNFRNVNLTGQVCAAEKTRMVAERPGPVTTATTVNIALPSASKEVRFGHRPLRQRRRRRREKSLAGYPGKMFVRSPDRRPDMMPQNTLSSI